MVRPLQKVTQFIWWMQTEGQMAANLHTKPNDLDSESASRLLPSTSTITICYYYSAWKLKIILQSYGEWKAEST